VDYHYGTSELAVVDGHLFNSDIVDDHGCVPGEFQRSVFSEFRIPNSSDVIAFDLVQSRIIFISFNIMMLYYHSKIQPLDLRSAR